MMVYESYFATSRVVPSEYFKEIHREIVNRDFYNSPTVRTIQHKDTNIKVRIVGIFTKESPTHKMEGYQKVIFNTVDYDVSNGDLFYFDDAYWICLDVATEFASRSCMIGRCSGQLSFYNLNVSDSVHLIPYLIYDNIALTRMGINLNQKHLTVPDSRVMAIVSATTISNEIRRDDIYNLQGSLGVEDTYRVLDINRVRSAGLIFIEFDYSPETQVLPDPIANYDVDGSDEIIKGMTETYVVRKYDNGVVNGTTFTFQIVSPEVPTSAYTLTVVEGNTCTIKANLTPFIIKLRSIDDDNGEYVDFDINLVNLF